MEKVVSLRPELSYTPKKAHMSFYVSVMITFFW